MKTTHIALLGTAASLIAVGLVSGTLVRHLVQIAPLVVALILARWWKPAVGAWAAVALLSFWMVVMVLIWLFLLGVSEVADGEFTAVEIALTVVIAACCAVGMVSAVRDGRSLSWWQAALTLAGGWAIQVAVMALSFAGPVACR